MKNKRNEWKWKEREQKVEENVHKSYMILLI